MNSIDELLNNNKIWSEQIYQENPTFFADLADQQNPEYLWIGCSDSRVSTNDVVGLRPGEVLVHRNIANLVNHTDMNCLSVIQFAVEMLQVNHIIVCGHYGCGGVEAALDATRYGLIDNWLRCIQDTANRHSASLSKIDDRDEKLNQLCRLNVAEQVQHVGETTIVQDAWNRGQQLQIHGWIYSLQDGLLSDLNISIDDTPSLENLQRRFLFSDQRPAAGPAS